MKFHNTRERQTYIVGYKVFVVAHAKLPVDVRFVFHNISLGFETLLQACVLYTTQIPKIRNQLLSGAKLAESHDSFKSVVG